MNREYWSYFKGAPKKESIKRKMKMRRVIFISILVVNVPFYLFCKFVGMIVCEAWIGLKEGWNGVVKFSKEKE